MVAIYPCYIWLALINGSHAMVSVIQEAVNNYDHVATVTWPDCVFSAGF